MKARSHRMTGLAVAVALAAFAAPAASAGNFDARSPDTKDVTKTRTASGVTTTISDGRSFDRRVLPATSDLRSPDTVAASLGDTTPLIAAATDLRSPDTVAAALAGTTPVIPVGTDLRSPDTVAAAALADSPPQASAPTASTIVDGDSAWMHALLGAAVGFAIALLLVAAAAIALRHGHRGRPVAPSA